MPRTLKKYKIKKKKTRSSEKKNKKRNLSKKNKIIDSIKINKARIEEKNLNSSENTTENTSENSSENTTENTTENSSDNYDEFKVLKCSPSRQNNGFTCYDNKELLKMRDLWNLRHPDLSINTINPQEIWNTIRDNMSNLCSEESCWLKKLFINMDNNFSKLLNYAFAPKAPTSWNKNINEWLSSVDIEKVMKQWEIKIPSFVFLGPTPIDFDDKIDNERCVWEDLCDFNLDKYIKKNKKKIGIIFNLDPHYKSGSHWVSLFIDIKKEFICYFDSNGIECPKRILKFVERVKKQGLINNINFRFIENAPKQHQYENTECGMYSLFFNIQLLTESRKPEYFKNNRISDKEMEKFRPIYFNLF